MGKSWRTGEMGPKVHEEVLAAAWYPCHRKRVSSPVQFSRSVVSDSLRPHGLQHARHPCLSPTPGVYSNLCSLSR